MGVGEISTVLVSTDTVPGGASGARIGVLAATLKVIVTLLPDSALKYLSDRFWTE